MCFPFSDIQRHEGAALVTGFQNLTPIEQISEK